MTTHTVPAGTMAEALVSAGVPRSNFVFYDVIEDLDERLGEAQLKQNVMSSMAWMLDNTCINFARSVYYDTYSKAVGLSKLETNTIPAFNALIMAMTDNDHELWQLIDESTLPGQHSFEIGYNDTSAIGQLKQCLVLRPIWHNAAFQATSAAGRMYQPKSFLELLASEKIRVVKAASIEELRLNAEFEANGDQAKTELILAEKIQRQKASAEMRFLYRKQADVAVAKILSIAAQKATLMLDNTFTSGRFSKVAHDDTDEGNVPQGFGHSTTNVAFHTLDLPLQIRLIHFAEGCVLRTLDQMASDTFTLQQNMAVARAEGHRCVSALRAVLEAPKFERAHDYNLS